MLLDKAIKLTKPFRDVMDLLLFHLVKGSNNWELLEQFRNKPILIVGNGPSLNKTPLDYFEGHVSLGMNKINMFFDKTSWRPDIVVCVNGAVISQNKEFFNTTDIPVILPPRALYLGIKKRKNIIILNFLKDETYSTQIQKSLANGVTVTYPCLQIAGYLNPSKVAIVGVDHNFKFQGESKEYQKMEEDDVNHFSKDYFKGKVWGTPDLPGSERQFLMARHYFDGKQIPIHDYTVGGKLQIFEKNQIPEKDVVG